MSLGKRLCIVALLLFAVVNCGVSQTATDSVKTIDTITAGGARSLHALVKKNKNEKADGSAYWQGNQAHPRTCKKTSMPTLVVGILLLAIAAVWRFFFWKKMAIRKKELVFLAFSLLSLAVVLLSWHVGRVILLCLFVVMVMATIAFLVIRKGRRQAGSDDSHEIGHTTQETRVETLEQEVRQLKAEIERLKKENIVLLKEKKDLFEENVSLGDRMEELRAIPLAQNSVEPSPPASGQVSATPAENNIKTTAGKLYAESIMDGILMKVRDTVVDDSIFELDLTNSGTATLTILPSAHQRILANSAYIDGCDKQIIGNSRVSVTPGRATINGNGKWIIEVRPVVIIS